MNILEERARALARPPPAPLGDRLDVVLCSLSGEAYALETAVVREVARLGDFSVVPGAPPILVGVTNLRGEVLPIFDLHALVGIVRKGLTDASRLLVVGDGRAELGLLADEVREVGAIPKDQILPAPEALAVAGRGLVRGVTSGAVIVLDGAGLLRDPRLFVNAGRDRTE